MSAPATTATPAATGSPAAPAGSSGTVTAPTGGAAGTGAASAPSGGASGGPGAGAVTKPQHATDKEEAIENVELSRIADISNKIRQGLRSALPAPPEQFLTVMVPGKVVNFKDHLGGFDANGNQTSVVLPLATELNNAILCDDMPAMAGIQLGPTGRSVARSYATVLSKIVAKGTTVGVDVAPGSQLGEQEARYQKAMKWLQSEDPECPGRTRVDIYVEKQRRYTQAVENKTKAFDEALKKAQCDPCNKTIAQQREAYDRWVLENARTYRNYVQAAYMDWVITGKKEAVEYWFAVVDVDSALSRVETSKECMRASVVMDTDGSSEYQKVKLMPSNWAWLAKQKSESVKIQKGGETIEYLTGEIGRLRKLNRMITALKASGVTPSSAQPPSLTEGNSEAEAAMTTFIKARTAHQTVLKDKTKSDDERRKTLEAMQTAQKALSTAMEKFDAVHYQRVVIQNQATQDWLVSEMVKDADIFIKQNEDAIKELDEKRDNLISSKTGDISEVVGRELGIPCFCPPKPAEETPVPTPDGHIPIKEEDFWTHVAIEVSGSYDHKELDTSATAVSSGGSAQWGCKTGSHSSASTKAANKALAQMAKSTVKISFEAMRVDIHRPWLRGELFYDDELTVSPGAHISPGPLKLAALMDPDNHKEITVGSVEQRGQELDKYGLFPMYPTAFILGANIVLEIQGETSEIQSYFHSSADASGKAVAHQGHCCYGPFNVSSSKASNKSHTESTCEATSNGCRITIKSPQIIGWVSQMLPALPRLPTPKTTISTCVTVTTTATATSTIEGAFGGSISAAAGAAAGVITHTA